MPILERIIRGGNTLRAIGMATTRKFTDFNLDDRGGLGMSHVPEDGFCLAAFVVLTDGKDSKKVLMGKMNSDAPWDHIGALDPERVERHKEGWTLPSCHLVLFESPDDASKRILREQLEINNLSLDGPIVFSDVRALKRAPNAKHWDLDFIFRGEISRDMIPRNPDAWKELDFVDYHRAPEGQPRCHLKPHRRRESQRSHLAARKERRLGSRPPRDS